MGHHSLHQSSASSSLVSSSLPELDAADVVVDIEWPFGKVEAADHSDLRETAYEVFFISWRLSLGTSGGRSNALSSRNPSTALQDGGEGPLAVIGGGCGGSGVSSRSGLGMVASSGSRIKKKLGLKTSPKRSPPRWAVGSSSSPAKMKRPLAPVELMRQQMRVSELSDNRLRKMLMRALVGQTGRCAETIILPLELLRYLKPSEFSNLNEYHLWQKRQLRIIEAGILLHPSVPLDRSDISAMRLAEIIRSSETRPVDTSKNSEPMKALCNCVMNLAWRSVDIGASSDTCHWADGFPINIHLYVLLLQSIFDLKDETKVLDEVDELIELMNKTWSTLGINKLLHKVCFTWLLFQQFVTTGQAEHDLLSAVLTLLTEVAGDAKTADREFNYVNILSSMLAMMQRWAEKQLLNYHWSFDRRLTGLMDSVLTLATTAAKILQENTSIVGGVLQQDEEEHVDSTEDRIDYFIRSSMRNAFTKVLENGITNSMARADADASKAIIQLAKDTEGLAMKEKEHFSCILKRWHPAAAGVAAVTLHNCFGFVLKQYLDRISMLTKEVIRVLQIAGKLEKILVQLVIEDCDELADGADEIIREMTPYDVDSTSVRLMKAWVSEKWKRAKQCLERAKETEAWSPTSKTEPYAQSAVDLMKLVRETVDDFFNISVKGTGEDLMEELVDGLETILMDYTLFVASCGSKQSYIPPLPALTRCNQQSKFPKLWKKVLRYRATSYGLNQNNPTDGHQPRPSTSRGTQRLFIRINTLYYLLSYIHSLDKSFSLSRRPTHYSRTITCTSGSVPSFFNLALSLVQSSIEHVTEVAAFRLIFLDSHSFFYESLYVGDIANPRIRPALRILKQNLTLLTAIVTDRAQPMAMKEVLKASFEAFLMVLLAGGSSRTFTQSDYTLLAEDFTCLKRLFCSHGDGLVMEEVVEEAAKVVHGVIALIGLPTEQLVEDFNILVGDAVTGYARRKVQMPQLTGRWNQADPNTILRVLCHRNDSVANKFLKKTFQLPKRK